MRRPLLPCVACALAGSDLGGGAAWKSQGSLAHHFHAFLSITNRMISQCPNSPGDLLEVIFDQSQRGVCLLKPQPAQPFSFSGALDLVVALPAKKNLEAFW